MGLLLWLSGRESACNARDAGDAGSIPGSGRSPGGGNGYLLQDSCLENLMDRGAWWAIVSRVKKRRTWLKRLGTHGVLERRWGLLLTSSRLGLCCVLGHVWPFVTPWTVACQAPLTMEFSRQEYWSGLPFLLQGIFLTQGSKPSLLNGLADSLPLSHLGSPWGYYICPKWKWVNYRNDNSKISVFNGRNVLIHLVKWDLVSIIVFWAQWWDIICT